MGPSCCLCVCSSPSTPINFQMPELIFMKSGMYITAPESISTAYFINHFHQPVCLYVYPLYLLGNDSVKNVKRSNEYISNTRTVARAVFYAVRVYQGQYGIHSFQNFFVYMVFPIRNGFRRSQN
jgi:hypothetical protein